MSDINTEPVDFYNPNSAAGRPAGVYLDVEERIAAEKRRAVAEGRDPDFENLPATAGTPLVTRAELPLAPIGTAPSPVATLDVALDDNDLGDDDERAEVAREANAEREKSILEAQRERVQREAENSRQAADHAEAAQVNTIETQLNDAEPAPVSEVTQDNDGNEGAVQQSDAANQDGTQPLFNEEAADSGTEWNDSSNADSNGNADYSDNTVNSVDTGTTETGEGSTDSENVDDSYYAGNQSTNPAG